jgi:hypothetical protein
MAIKLRPSIKTRSKQTGKIVTENYYLKSMTVKELNEYIDGSNSKPKIVQKCRNELIKRRNK